MSGSACTLTAGRCKSTLKPNLSTGRVTVILHTGEGQTHETSRGLADVMSEIVGARQARGFKDAAADEIESWTAEGREYES